MATEKLGIVIDATVKGAKDVKRFGDDLGELERNAKGTGRVLKDDLGGAFNKLNTILAGAAIAGIAAGAAALFDFGKQSLQTASDVQEMSSKFDTVFRHLSEDVTSELQQFADAANRSVYDLKGFAATLQDTFVPLGFARGEAASMSVQLVKLAEDLASFNNLRTEDVVRDLQSALVGNTETLRKYGVVAQQTQIQNEAFNSGIWDGEEALTANMKAQAILNLTLKSTTDAQGDAIKTADSYENVSKGLTAAITDLQVSIGDGLIPAMTQGKTAMTEYVNTLNDAILSTRELSDLQSRGIDTSDKIGLSFGKAAIALAAMTGDQEVINAAMEIANDLQEEYNESVTAAERPIRRNADAVDELTDKLREQQEQQDRVNAITEDAERMIARYGLGLNATTRELEEAYYAADELAGNKENLSAAIEQVKERLAAEEAALIRSKTAHDEAIEAARELTAARGDQFNANLQAGESTETLTGMLYDAVVATDAGAETLARLAVATGEYTKEQVQAALRTAVMEEQINLLAASVAAGTMSVTDATAALANMDNKLQGAIAHAYEFSQGLASIREEADKLDGRTVDVTVNVTRTGELPSGLGSGGDGPKNDGPKYNSPGSQGARASGGPVFAGNAYLVGEQGPEVVVMGGNGTVIPNNSLGGNTINITVTAGGMNGRRIGQQIATEVTNALGRLN
jgi:uncharacterized coiled-coil protein SlyX